MGVGRGGLRTRVGVRAGTNPTPRRPSRSDVSRPLLALRLRLSCVTCKSDVHIEIGVGSPIPVDAFISAQLPDTCAQFSRRESDTKDLLFEIRLRAMPGTREECFRDTLPFRIAVPLNMVSLPTGTYTVKVNSASTTFQWPSEPTVTPEPAMTVPAEWEAYRNDAIHFEIDYPQGWIVDEGGDTDILWSEKPNGPGHDGVPANVVKIDIVTEPNTTTTLDELVARQKQIIADNNGQVQLEEAVLLSRYPARRADAGVRLGESVSLLAIIDGHPVMLVGYGDLSRFEEVARTLRAVEPYGHAESSMTIKQAQQGRRERRLP